MYDSSYKFPYNDNKMVMLLNIMKARSINLFKQSQVFRYTNGRSTDMARQILSFFRPEFSVITDLTGHFFSWTTGKEFVRDTLKPLEIIWTIFKQMRRFFTDNNLITTLCSVQIQFYQSIAPLLIDIES